jgi:hypothetical protein
MKMKTQFFQTTFLLAFLLLPGCGTALALPSPTATLIVTETATFIPNWDVPTPIPAKNGWTLDYISAIPAASLDTKSQSEIAFLLFEEYLAHFKTPDADSRNGLVDYEILEVKAEPDIYYFLAVDQKVDYVATALYSVRPSILMYSNWVAANGVVNFESGWINQKFELIGIVRENDVYRIKILGTGY